MANPLETRSMHAKFGRSWSNGKSVITRSPVKGSPLTSRILRSLEVIGTDTDRSANYDFLLVIHYNHGPILYCFRDKRRFWMKIAYFSNPVYFTPRLKFPMAGTYLRGWLRDQTPKCSPQNFSTLFRHVSAVAAVNIVTSKSIAFSFHLTLKKC